MLKSTYCGSLKLSICVIGLFACVICAGQAQAPYAPFTAKQAELGKALADKSTEVRRQITNSTEPQEPFKIIGNLYFVGNNNGEVYR